MASLEGTNLLALLLSASEVWTDKWVAFGGRDNGDYVIDLKNKFSLLLKSCHYFALCFAVGHF